MTLYLKTSLKSNAQNVSNGSLLQQISSGNIREEVCILVVSHVKKQKHKYIMRTMLSIVNSGIRRIEKRYLKNRGSIERNIKKKSMNNKGKIIKKNMNCILYGVE